jgi:hypothetical protein
MFLGPRLEGRNQGQEHYDGRGRRKLGRHFHGVCIRENNISPI